MKRAAAASPADLLDRALGVGGAAARKRPRAGDTAAAAAAAQRAAAPPAPAPEVLAASLRALIGGVAHSPYRAAEAGATVGRVVDTLRDADTPAATRLRALGVLAALCDALPDARAEFNAHVQVLAELGYGDGGGARRGGGPVPPHAAATAAEARAYARRLLARLRDRHGRTDMPAALTAAVLVGAAGGRPAAPTPLPEEPVPLSDEEVAALVSGPPGAATAPAGVSGGALSNGEDAGVPPAQLAARLTALGVLPPPARGAAPSLPAPPARFDAAGSPLLAEIAAALGEVEACLAAMGWGAPSAAGGGAAAAGYESDGSDGFRFGDDDNDGGGASGEDDGWQDAVDAPAPAGEGGEEGVDHGAALLAHAAALPPTTSDGGDGDGGLSGDEADGRPAASAAPAVRRTGGATPAAGASDPLGDSLRDALKPLLRRLLPALREARALASAPVLPPPPPSSSGAAAVAGAVALQRAVAPHVHAAYRRADAAVGAARRAGVDLAALREARAQGGAGRARAAPAPAHVHVPRADSEEAQRAAMQALLQRQHQQQVDRATRRGDTATLRLLSLAGGGISGEGAPPAAAGGAAAAAAATAPPAAGRSRSGGGRGGGRSGGAGGGDAAARLRRALNARKRSGGHDFAFLSGR